MPEPARASRRSGVFPPHARRTGRSARNWLAPLALSFLGLVGGCGRATPERVVLVTVDTLRADHVGAYGHAPARTATMDGLARRGVRFETALSPVPLTLPSHTSLMTALEPPRHGVRHNSIFSVPGELPLLAERMRAGGFGTAAFVGALVLDGRFGLSRGFDVYDEQMGDRHSGLVGFAERPADRVVDAALAWVATAPPKFFLWVHFYDPHALYQPPPAYALSFASQPYDGEIAFTDVQLGRLLAGIDARFGAEGTLVAVTADHGESLGEHGEPTHSYSLYDATQRIPLILAGPGLPAGATVSEVVRLVDVAPTILSLVGLPPLDGVDGEDLLPLVRGAGGAPRTAYLETLATQLDMGWAPLFGLRDRTSLFIRAPRNELYDVIADPRELRNLAAEDPTRVAAAEGELDRILARAVPLEASVELDAADRARLESLGYVVPTADDLARAGAGATGPDPKDEMPVIVAMNRATELLQKGRPREAFEILRAEGDRGSYLLSLRAMAALAAGIPAEAERDARLAAESSPNRDDLAVLLGDALLLQGRLDEAETSFERARTIAPQLARPVIGLGRVSEARGDRSAAIRRYRDARDTQQMREESLEATWRLAAVLLENGDETEADALLAGLPAAAADGEVAAFRIAQAELAVGRLEAAVARLERAAAAYPNSVGIQSLAGAALDRAGRLSAALAARERALALSPDSPGAQNDLAWALVGSGGDLERALVLAEKAHAAAPEVPELVDTLALVRLRRGEPRRALEILDAAMRDGARSPLLDLRRADVLDALGRPDEARRAFRRATAGLAEPYPGWAAGASEIARRLGLPWPPKG